MTFRTFSILSFATRLGRYFLDQKNVLLAYTNNRFLRRRTFASIHRRWPYSRFTRLSTDFKQSNSTRTKLQNTTILARFYAINDRRLIYSPEMLSNALQRLIRIPGFFLSGMFCRCHTKRRTRNVWSEKWGGLGGKRLNDTKRKTVITTTGPGN